MLAKMFSKKFFLFGFLYLTVAADTGDRIKIKESLKVFLAALEPYQHTQNDVVFLLDESGSIGAETFPEVKEFSKMIARQFSVSSEKTRVAVVTFATEPNTHINYIKNPNGNNMCSLLVEIDDIGYAAQWTHTDKAMIEAENILHLARPNSNKIIVLLSDGQSNDGHSPLNIAFRLKARGIIIFAVGVSEVNTDEIMAIATSPNHTYILDEFSHIVQVNDYLVNDVEDVSLDLSQDSSKCKSTCDNHAKCYCGARSGAYECKCDAGYYGTGGFVGQCHKCPKGTFKAESENTKCTPCPEHSTTLKEGSTSFNDCRCDIGYEKNGTSCLPITCAALSAPEGGILIPTHCSNTFGTQCSFKCNIGHCPFSCKDYPPQQMNNHIVSTQRTCLENRRWSKEEFHCEKISCPVLSYPLNGNHNCTEKDFTYGSTCDFKCDKGYELHGTVSRTCGFKGWTGQDVKCKEIHCDKLKTNDLLHVKPVECSTQSRPYLSICRYHCKKGFRLVLQGNSTDGVLKCEKNKKWSHDFDKITCIDDEPPKIKCPNSITVNTDIDKSNALVNWNLPVAVDNVEVVDIRIIEPNGIKKPPYAFPINTTKVVYEAIDSSKHTKTCSFTVTVVDNEPPKVVSCPSNIEVYHHRNTPISVTWDGPMFEDNSKYVTISSSRKSGDKFAWGPASTVIYTASDSSKNNASCNFTVKVKHYPCPYYDPPANGSITCDTWEDGRLCSIFCHDGFEFASSSKNIHTVYLCHQVQSNGVVIGKWESFLKIPGFKMPWPDCSRKQQPTSLNVAVGISYSVDSCSEDALKKLRENFINNLKKKLPPAFCREEKGCMPENVNVNCGPALVRRKRSFYSDTHLIQQESLFKHGRVHNRAIRYAANQMVTISFNMFVLLNATEQNIHKKSPKETGKDEISSSSNSFIEKLQDAVSLEVKDAYNVTHIPKSEINYRITAVCSTGQITVNNSCLNCPAGTYKDDVSESCVACPVATFQEEEGHLSCKACPVGYTTYQVKSKSLNDCKGPCQPGTYSKTTFEPCLACPFNTYQDRSARKECFKCPSGLYTWRVGVNSSSSCVAPCEPGTFSDTGYEPCKLCEFGTYQDKEMQKTCISCPYQESTTDRGSKSVEDCKGIDICSELQPCQYNSSCFQLDKEYKCLCPNGLSGRNCEINSDDCESSPCLNNGTCIDGIGNFTCLCLDGWEGNQCEVNHDDCKPNRCLNGGKCIDELNTFECQCIPGFTGDRCERNIYECESNPCLNDGVCFDMRNDYRCCCTKEYFGKNCEKKINTSICDTITCQNGGTCLSDDNGYNCTCLEGFEGNFCETNIDDCKDFWCENDGICVDGNGNATCMCHTKFTGEHCEEVLSPDFILSFPTPDTSNYAKIENNNILYAITVAFLMRTSFKDQNSRATPFSYSYNHKNHYEYNALTLLDTNNFVLFIHGRPFHTEYSANRDALWHHYAITWNKIDGKWAFYVDGKMLDSGYTGKDKYMYSGIFVLGQEQDDMGGKFSALEAFSGEITQFNVWDYAFTDEEVKQISSACGYVGNIIPWHVVSQSIFGHVIKSHDVSKCKEIGQCPENSCDCFYSNTTDVLSCKYEVKECINEKTCLNNQSCISDIEHSYCQCDLGFEGRHCEYDVDECLEENGGCNYICINDIGTGSYHCECPVDMILSEDGKTCKDTSYCIKEDQIYVNGEHWMDSCENCVCDHGNIFCKELSCNETTCYPEETMITFPGDCCPKCVAWSFCLISPNNTITSFEMSNYHIDGECIYTVLEDCIGGHFKVQVESPQSSALEKKLIIYQDCHKVVVSSNGTVSVDDIAVTLPFENEELIMELNSSITIRTNSDLLLQWNFTEEILIAVPITDVKNMCGICNIIEEYYGHDLEKFHLTDRFASGEKECFLISDEMKHRNCGSLSMLSSSEVFPVLWLTAFLCLLINIRSLCFY